MNMLNLLAREFIGLFVDDERLALSVIAVVSACAFVALVLHAEPLTVELLLTTGCLGVLTASIAQARKR